MPSDYRTITDPKAVRGMAHPLRLQILDLLRYQGPMTATEVSQQIGESPANCSFHLRTLAKYGFIEEADTGKGRNRPWRALNVQWTVEEDDLTDDAKRAAPALGALIRRRAYEAIERWHSERNTFPAKWRKSAFDTQNHVALTAAELATVGEQIKELLAPYQQRADVPDDALNSSVVTWGFPAETAKQRRQRLARTAST